MENLYTVSKKQADCGSDHEPLIAKFRLKLKKVGKTVIAMLSGKQTHSEGQCRKWSAVYYTRGPRAESPLSQGTRPAFVKIFYTPCVRV